MTLWQCRLPTKPTAPLLCANPTTFTMFITLSCFGAGRKSYTDGRRRSAPFRPLCALPYYCRCWPCSKWMPNIRFHKKYFHKKALSVSVTQLSYGILEMFKKQYLAKAMLESWLRRGQRGSLSSFCAQHKSDDDYDGGRSLDDLGLRASAQKLPFIHVARCSPSFIHSSNTFSLADSRDLTMGEVAIFHFLKPKRTNERANLAMKQ